jgi:hypothetical protein
MDQIKEPSLLQQPARDLWKLEDQLGIVLQGDCYRAERYEGKDDAVLWLSRKSLSQEQQAQFTAHVERLKSVRNWGEIECGVDAEQHGFVAIKHGATKSIQFDAPGMIAARNRFLMCVTLISQMHDAGITCGNITPGSFAVDSFDVVQFIGFMGGYAEKMISTIPLEIKPFLCADEQRGAAPSARADVYALAVIGLGLFGAQFPPAMISAQQMDNYVEQLSPTAPPWALSVLSTIIREPKQRLCANASELLRAISAQDAQYITDLKREMAHRRADRDEDQPLSIEEIRQIYATSEHLRRSSISAILHSNVFKAAAFGVFGFTVLTVVVAYMSPLQNMLPAWVRPRANIGDVVATATEVKDALATLKRLGDVEGQPGAEESLPRNVTIEPGSVILTNLERGEFSPEERSTLYGLYGELDTQSKTRIATTTVKVGSDIEREFREMLIKQLQRSALIERPALEKLSTDALFLAVESRLSKEAVQVWGRLDAVSNDELLWLLKVHARKRAPVSSALANAIVSRRIAAREKAVFFKVAADAGEGSGAPYEVLFRGGTDGVTASDVQVLSDWSDPLAARALYAVLLSTADPEISARAMAQLVSKSGVTGFVSASLDVLYSGENYSTAQAGKLIGALGLADEIDEDFLNQGFESLRGSPMQGPVLEVVLPKGSPRVVEAALRVFGKDIHPAVFTALLDRPEPEIRRAAIPFLKEVRIASLRTRIRERYEAETDPEVRRVFEAELYSYPQ